MTLTSANKHFDDCVEFKGARGHKTQISKDPSFLPTSSNKARHRQPRLRDAGPDDAYTVETQLH